MSLCGGKGLYEYIHTQKLIIIIIIIIITTTIITQLILTYLCANSTSK
jgi:hypothetical protein